MMVAEKSEEVPQLKTPSLSLPAYWLSVHSVSKQIPELAGKPDEEQKLIRENLGALLREVEEYPVQRWARFCKLCGLTFPSLVVASWCKGANVPYFLQFVQEFDADYANLPQEDFALLPMLHEQILPEPALSDVVHLADGAMNVAILLIQILQAHNITIHADLPRDRYEKLNPLIRELIEKE